MVITRGLIVDIPFAAAQARLARVMDSGGLDGMSRDAYDGALTRLIRVGPLGAVPGISKLVRIRFLGPVQQDVTRTIWLRWEATGPASGLFPGLDADLRLAAEGQGKTRVTLKGSYRPPLGRLGTGLDRLFMHRVAAATISALLHSIAGTLAEPERLPAPHQEHPIGPFPQPPGHRAR